TTYITLPFAFQLYGQIFTSAYVSSNGALEFASNDSAPDNTCLPYSGFSYTILPHWDNLRTDCSGCYVLTSVGGSAPNRTFNIDWIASYVLGGETVEFEVRLYEGSAARQFDIVYGPVGQGG